MLKVQELQRVNTAPITPDLYHYTSGVDARLLTHIHFSGEIQHKYIKTGQYLYTSPRLLQPGCHCQGECREADTGIVVSACTGQHYGHKITSVDVHIPPL